MCGAIEILETAGHEMLVFRHCRHLIFAPSAHDQYAGSAFPGVEDAMFEATSFADWQEVDRQLSLLAVHIRYAANILNQYTEPVY